MDHSALLEKLASTTATEDEIRDFNDWLKTLPADEYKQVLNEYEGLLLKKEVKEAHRQEWLEELLNKIKAKEAAPVIPMHSNKNRVWWAVAASIVLLLGIGSYLFFGNKAARQQGNEATNAIAHDVPAPSSTRAMITLADGTKVYLDSVGSGTIAQQSGASVIKNQSGVISYELNREDANPDSYREQGTLVYNTLSNPRGSKVINMTLSDGSHVWLNAGSSVTYPVAFIGNERKVEITGEAYFEVTHDVSKPFVVSKGETSVTVLGTHFNVNAYDDEESLKVTLLEGSVRVESPALKGTPFSKGGQPTRSVVIKPGEQAVITSSIQVNKDVDVDEVMAWKNGTFSFKSTDLKSMMRQIARWYDVDVNYESNVANETISGEISRNVNVSQVMKMLEFAGVRFRIEGNKITVLK